MIDKLLIGWWLNRSMRGASVGGESSKGEGRSVASGNGGGGLGRPTVSKYRVSSKAFVDGLAGSFAST